MTKVIEVEPIGDEKSKAEAVQETVHDEVELLLQKLVKSPIKDNTTQANTLLSHNHHISALASSTSSLAITDDSDSQSKHLSTKEVVQMLSTPPKGNLFEELPEDENIENSNKKENNKQYYPLFYKNSSAKKLTEYVILKLILYIRHKSSCVGKVTNITGKQG